jgi:hypothetical protein
MSAVEKVAEAIWNAQHQPVPALTWDEISIPGKWIGVQEALDGASAAIDALAGIVRSLIPEGDTE